MVPNCAINLSAVFSLFHPFHAGKLLSVASPINPITSTTRAGSTPNRSCESASANHFVLHWIVNTRDRGQELEHVLVAGDDRHREPLPLRPFGQGADEIVRLIAGLPDAGNRHRLDHPVDVRNLGAIPWGMGGRCALYSLYSS